MEKLAIMIAKGFEGTASTEDLKQVKVDIKQVRDELKGDIKHLDDRVGHLDDRVGHLDDRVGHIEASMSSMAADLHEMKGNVVYKYEFEDLMARVKYLETKLNIESGK